MVLDLSAVELARRMRSRELSPVEVVEAHIRRIEAVNPVLNAVVAERFEAAMDEAREAESRLGDRRRKHHPPLLGVPCTIKEFLGLPGMPCTAGLVARQGQCATEEASVVRRLREAGAVVLGVTNVPEGGLWLETHNRIYGRTRNPWDPRRSPGGSSGGEGAIVGAGGAAFGMGSDVGGSIRLPAAMCGTFGHKPTGRMVPNTGHFPKPAAEGGAYLCIGPLARSAEDLMPLLRVIAGPDQHDPLTRSWPLGDPAALDPRRLVVRFVPDLPRPWVRPAVKDALLRAASDLEAMGARVEPLALPALRRAFDIWSAMLEEAAEGADYSEVIGDGRPVRLGREFVKLLLRRSPHTTPALITIGAQALVRRLGRDNRTLIEEGLKLQAELEAALGEQGVLLHPPYSRSAPRHRAPMLIPFDFVTTAIFNVLELPVTEVPVGFDPKGLPLGVQVAARRGADHLAIGTAMLLEQAGHRWHRAPVPTA